MAGWQKFYKKPINRNLIIFAVALAAAIFFWSSISLRDFLNNIVILLEKYIQSDPLLGIFIFTLLSALSAMLSPFSSVPLVPAAVVLWGKFLTFLFLWLGWSLGEAAAYYVGKSAAHRALNRFIDIKKIDYYSQRFSQRTNFWTVMLFRASLPAEIPGYVLGILKYNFWKYQIATSLAELPFAVATVYASQALLAEQKTYFILWLAFGLLSMSIAFYYFQKKITRK
jgi:uncharacterized membrane protein YdjX (TVP38/TMEM64 family)